MAAALGMALLAASPLHATAPGGGENPVPSGSRGDFGLEPPTSEARHLADWVVAASDNEGLPFIIIDKVQARVMVFDAAGSLRGVAPALLGLAHGDDTPAGIGTRSLSEIGPGDRITPAGRFATVAGTNLAGKDVLWIEYASALSLHPVVTGSKAENRLARLESRTVLDNRISFGCVNVPAEFYARIIKSTFAKGAGITYILPEHKSIDEAFGIRRRIASHLASQRRR